jgi:hypothetical protein
MHRDCPEGTACFIRHLKEKRGISANEAIRQYSKESGIPVKTLERWFWGKAKPEAKPKKEVDRLERVLKLIEKLSQDELRQLKAFLLDTEEVPNA